jgi:caspase domain-containing protein/N-acetylmuramoyl-L-alanine amidase-like protein
MPRPFIPLALTQFAQILARPLQRKIVQIHVHHTWRPNHAQYRGLASIEGMYQYHTGPQNRWCDIAQHVTIAPDGTIWTGRDWNRPPASSAGANGTSREGPFMFEIVGDFDEGKDRLEGRQLDSVLHVIALLQMKFGLENDAIRFHNELGSPKTCPGTAIRRAALLEAIDKVRSSMLANHRRDLFVLQDMETETAFDTGGSALPDVAGRAIECPEEVNAEAPCSMIDPLYETVMSAAKESVEPVALRGTARGLTGSDKAALKPYVINLSSGHLSDDGEYTTSMEELDAIFSQHLERWVAGADAQNPRKVVIYAHGGLVNEESGLWTAKKHIDWWLSNRVYPIYFAWETGLGETIANLLSGSLQRGAARDIFDYTSDPVVEAMARTLGGVKLWTGMKVNARVSSQAPDGGAWLFLQKLSQFCGTHRNQIQLHAVGHSAGSIFHAAMLPAFLDMNPSQPIETLHLLAPAIRVDEFLGTLKPRIGNGVGHVTMYTMAEQWEKQDHCAHIYRKSLLYLLYYALETARKTGILGLEECVRRDAGLRQIFGLDGPSRAGEVIWSVSQANQGRFASQSESHGGFDDDPATMNSVLRRILGVPDSMAIQPYPGQERGRGVDIWGGGAPASTNAKQPPPPKAPVRLPLPGQPSDVLQPPLPPRPAGTGARRALCVGINYTGTRAELKGCINDMNEWATTFADLRFEVTSLVEQEATYQRMRQALTDLVDSAKPGDTLVFQYAGHGTQVPDLNHDEAEGRDQAFVPYDWQAGCFLVDDEILTITSRLPEAASLTFFVDCCHSGTITRAAALESDPAADERIRFLQLDADVVKKFIDRYKKESVGRAAFAPNDGEPVAINFAACQDYQSAYEKDGRGDFTRNTVPLLRDAAGRINNQAFFEQVTKPFAGSQRQNPNLYCRAAARTALLLG